MSKTVISCEGLTKYYGKSRGIEDLTFEVRPGQVYGFLGPNGAGKTTTIRCLLSMLRPTSGKAYLFGEEVGICLLYTSDAADDLLCVDLGGRRIIKKKKKKTVQKC